MSDGDLRGRIVTTAKSRVRKRFSWPVIAEQYEELFLHTCERKKTDETDR
jgi:hypothetical protein